MSEETPSPPVGSQITDQQLATLSTAAVENIITMLGVFVELFEQTDRGLAIVAAAFLDELLISALKANFFNSDKESENLFGPDAALGSFDSKARLAHAMGIIGPMAFNDLSYIRKIRNRFAHASILLDSQRKHVQLTFDAQQIRNWCGNLKIPENLEINKGVDGIVENYKLPALSVHKKKFLEAFFGLYVVLTQATYTKVTPARTIDYPSA